MARHHIREKSDRKADRPGKERKNLNGNEEWGQEHGCPFRHKMGEKLKALTSQRRNNRNRKNEKRQRQRYRNMACESKTIREQPKIIPSQNKEKERKNKWEEGRALRADRLDSHIMYKFIPDLGRSAFLSDFSRI